jgi:hypothetical protein
MRLGKVDSVFKQLPQTVFIMPIKSFGADEGDIWPKR